MNNNFIKILNNTVYNNEKYSIKEIDNMYLSILIYINFSKGLDSISRISIEELLKFSNIKIRHGKKSSINRVKNILKELEKNNIVKFHNSIDEAKLNSLIVCNIINEPDREFFILNIENAKKISLKEKIDNRSLLKVYCYILSRLKRRNKTLEDDKSAVIKAETFHDTLDNISFDLDISKTSLIKYLDILIDMELIHYGNIGLIKRKGRVTLSNNCYTIDSNELILALEQEKEFYKKRGYTILDKNISIESRQINMLNSKIKQLEKDDKDTSDLEDKLKELVPDVKEETNLYSGEVKEKLLNLLYYELNINLDEKYIEKLESIDSDNKYLYEDFFLIAKRNLSKIKIQCKQNEDKIKNKSAYVTGIISNIYNDNKEKEQKYK